MVSRHESVTTVMVRFIAASGAIENIMKRTFTVLGAIISIIMSLASLSPAQETNPPSQLPSLGRAQGNLPIWEKADADSIDKLTANARTLRDGIMLVGKADAGRGTAFVISRKHRLLATNAHVADIVQDGFGPMLALRNNTLETYKVAKVWYHPGLYRIQGGKTVVRSMDPKDGRVFTCSPDIAVLQLEEGPDIPREFELATWDEIKDLFARPLGMLGFPGHDTPTWPERGRKPVATFHYGIVTRLTDFDQQPDVGERRLQFVQHTATSWPGFSGSPLFLPNGRVAAINNCGDEVEDPNPGRKNAGLPPRRKSLQYGIRIDCLRELLAYHKLEQMVTIPREKDEPAIPKTEAPDPKKEADDAAEAARMKLREANRKRVAQIVEEMRKSARRHIVDQKYREALELCDDAIKLFPNYGGLHSVRALACINLATSREYRNLRLTDPRKRDLLRNAAEAAKRYVELVPSDPEGYILVAHIVGVVELAQNDELPAASKGWAATRQMTSMLTQLLSAENLTPYVRAAALCKRGELRVRLGESKAALDDFGEAIRVFPEHIESYRRRADYWEAHGKPELAKADRNKASEIESKEQESRFQKDIEGFFELLEKEAEKK